MILTHIRQVMDKSWINKPRNTLEYAKGLEGFLDFAFLHASSNDRIKCLSNRCGFRQMETREVVLEHLMRRQFPLGYTSWLCHGESRMVENEEALNINHDITTEINLLRQELMHNLIYDPFGRSNDMVMPEGISKQYGERTTLLI